MEARFGVEIRRRRLEAGLTLEQLAERAGLTPNYIGTIEGGKRDPSLSTVEALARGFGISPAEFFPHQDLSPGGAQAGHLYDQAPGEIQSAVISILQFTSRKRR